MDRHRLQINQSSLGSNLVNSVPNQAGHPVIMAIVALLRCRAPLLLPLLLLAAVAVILLLPSPPPPPPLPLHPVVVVPGYATNELDARLTDLYRPPPPSPSSRCGAPKVDDEGWFRLYLNHTALQDAAGVRCFAEQMTSVYDAASGDYYNAVGVETRVPFFGSVRGLRRPDPARRNFSYMDRFLARLEAAGYRDGETLFGAPYDFRYAVAPPGCPARVGTAFAARLRRLVELASRRNGGRPVTIVAHSYGGTLAHQFLLRRPLQWRRRFVRRFVPVAAPWGGVVLGMHALAAGNNLGLPFVDPAALQDEYRSLQSSLWPLPNLNAFAAARPLVTTRSRSYTAGDMPDFLRAVGLGEAVRPYESCVLPLFRELPPPQVPVVCVVGVGVDTPETLAYPGDDFDAAPRMAMGDGDGLVNLASLVAVDPAWRRRRGGEFRMVKLRNVSHIGLLVDDRALTIIIDAILRPNLSDEKKSR
ncbi:hypothetical protein ACP4OV_003017 [Aristida adscensionis]